MLTKMNVDTPNPVSAEEAYNRASKKLTRSLVIMGVLEMLVIAIGATLFYFSVQEGAVLPAMVGVVAMFLGIFVSAVFLIFLMFGLIKLQELFWKETAEGLGYAYVKNPPITADALMFREGHGRSTGHGLLGHLSDEHPFRFFSTPMSPVRVNQDKRTTFVYLRFRFQERFHICI